MAFLARSDHESRQWLNHYLTTFLERELPQLGITIPSQTLRRFWMMLCHYHGQVINFSEIGRALGVSDMTVRKYIDILESTLMVRTLQPWYNNLGKRLIKRPKIYFKDSGLLHRLFTIETEEDLWTHPKVGASWEGFALEETICRLGLNRQEAFFWGTHGGAGLDLFWRARGKNWGAEFKYADAPKLTRSMQSVVNDLQLSHLWVIYPGEKTYPLMPKVTVTPRLPAEAI